VELDLGFWGSGIGIGIWIGVGIWIGIYGVIVDDV
jgi:hypothetical protein